MTLERENFDSDWALLSDSVVNSTAINIPGLVTRVGRHDSVTQSASANGAQFITYRGKWLEAILCYRSKAQSIFKTT